MSGKNGVAAVHLIIIRLYCAFRSYSLVYVLENGSTLGVLYISYSVVDDQRHK